MAAKEIRGRFPAVAVALCAGMASGVRVRLCCARGTAGVCERRALTPGAPPRASHGWPRRCLLHALFVCMHSSTPLDRCTRIFPSSPPIPVHALGLGSWRFPLALRSRVHAVSALASAAGLSLVQCKSGVLYLQHEPESRKQKAIRVSSANVVQGACAM